MTPNKAEENAISRPHSRGYNSIETIQTMNVDMVGDIKAATIDTTKICSKVLV